MSCKQMLGLYIFFVIIISSILLSIGKEDEIQASNYHDNVYEPQKKEWLNKLSLATWNFESTLTQENSLKLKEVTLDTNAFLKDSWKVLDSFDWRNFQNETLKRLFLLNSNVGNSALDPKKLEQLTHYIMHMTSIYTKTTICDYNDKRKCNLQLNPDVLQIMASSRNYYELQHVWEEWHNKCGRPLREFYKNYVSLSNEAAHLNGFRSTAETWINKYLSETFERDIDVLWQQLQPDFLELHAYVRRKLISVYGEEKVRPDGPIPAHILGDQWSQVWSPLYSLVVPFPNKPTLDVTEALVQQGYTVKQMFELADNFYQSLGLKKVPDSFWKLSIFTKPPDRDTLCHATAWNIREDDVRIRMCSQIQMFDLITMHHELGHIQYYLQFNHLPSTFRQSANPGFHEAIGDTIALSVQTPKHLKSIGLLDEEEFEDDEEFQINFLMINALRKLAALPFAYLVDKYRWSIFRGQTTPDNYNAHWWKMSKDYQGVEPPVPRSEMDFDAGTKMHVARNIPFISYFVSTILQFQFHEALCLAANEYDPIDPRKPLHNCDIYGNKRAGELFGKMLSNGISKPWEDVLEEMTGNRRMDASSMIKFFEPLLKYIRMENKKNNEYIGWRENTRSKWVGLPLSRMSDFRKLRRNPRINLLSYYKS